MDDLTVDDPVANNTGLETLDFNPIAPRGNLQIMDISSDELESYTSVDKIRNTEQRFAKRFTKQLSIGHDLNTESKDMKNAYSKEKDKTESNISPNNSVPNKSCADVDEGPAKLSPADVGKPPAKHDKPIVVTGCRSSGCEGNCNGAHNKVDRQLIYNNTRSRSEKELLDKYDKKMPSGGVTKPAKRYVERQRSRSDIEAVKRMGYTLDMSSSNPNVSSDDQLKGSYSESNDGKMTETLHKPTSPTTRSGNKYFAQRKRTSSNLSIDSKTDNQRKRNTSNKSTDSESYYHIENQSSDEKNLRMKLQSDDLGHNVKDTVKDGKGLPEVDLQQMEGTGYKPKRKRRIRKKENNTFDDKQTNSNKGNEYENIPDNSRNKAKITKVYVILCERVAERRVLKEFVKHRMGNPKALDFKVDNVETMQQRKDCTLVTLEFTSTKKASSAVSLMNKSNTTSKNKVHCFLDKRRALGEIDSLRVDREEEVHKAYEAIFNTCENSLKEHDSKITTLQTQVNHVKAQLEGKIGALHFKVFTRLCGEKDALSDKLYELKLQRGQFICFIKVLRSKLDDVKEHDKYDSELKEIRSALGVECYRLNAALPMYARREDILTMVKENKVSVVLGETGSGKSTQMVQYLYQAGLAGEITLVLDLNLKHLLV